MNEDATPTQVATTPNKRGRGIVGIVAVVGLVVAFLIIKNQDPLDRFIPRRWATVEEGHVYRSGQLHGALVKRTWEEHGIEVVINLGEDKPGRADHIAAIEAADELGIDRVFFHLGGDGTGDPEMYVGAIKKLVESRRAGKTAVVHCAAGVYRTGGVVATYRMFVEGWSQEDAYREMFDGGVPKRPDTPILPYLDEHHPWIRMRLVEEGVIEDSAAASAGDE